MSPNESKPIDADGPINSRTVKRHELGLSAKEKIGVQAGEQLERLQARLAGQDSLERQLGQKAAGRERVHPLSVGAPVLLLLGVGAIVLGSRLPSLAWVASGAVGTAASVLCFVWLYRRRARVGLGAPVVAREWIPISVIQQFDELILRVGTELDEVNLNALNKLKERLAQMIKLAQQEGVSEHFTSDDQMYLIETMRRYVPDSLEAYLAIPKKLRAENLPQSSETATSLLTQQLQLIDSKLVHSEKKLGLAAAELLLRQQRFLEIKTKA